MFGKFKKRKKSRERVEIEKDLIDGKCLCEINASGKSIMGYCHKHRTDWL